LSNDKYGILYWNDPWLVFKRGATDHESYKLVQKKLNQLRKEWQINPTPDIS
jgi:hypothetical protein